MCSTAPVARVEREERRVIRSTIRFSLLASILSLGGCAEASRSKLTRWRFEAVYFFETIDEPGVLPDQVSTNRISISFATSADAAEIAALSRRHIEYGLRWRYTPPRIRALIRDRAKNVIVARDGDRLAGFGIMSYGEDCANLDLLAVPARYRRRGVGKRIVGWLEKVARTAGIASVFVQVRESNHGAIRFYRALGYLEVTGLAGYYQDREAAIVMGKPVRSLVAVSGTATAGSVS